MQKQRQQEQWQVQPTGEGPEQQQGFEIPTDGNFGLERLKGEGPLIAAAGEECMRPHLGWEVPQPTTLLLGQAAAQVISKRLW